MNICINCGKKFVPPPNHPDNPCCTPKCWNEYKNKQNGNGVPQLNQKDKSIQLQAVFKTVFEKCGLKWKEENIDKAVEHYNNLLNNLNG